MRSIASWLRRTACKTSLTFRQREKLVTHASLLCAADHLIFSRAFSSGEAPSLKKQIRELYKLVHPDLYQDHQEAREANGRSLQLLQEYLDSAKKGGELGRTAGVPFHFSFYLRESQASEEEESEGELQHVAVSLPPPARMDSTAAVAGQYPRATQLAIGKLLTACGLSNDFNGAVDESQVSNSLLEFIPGAGELARQRGLQQAGSRAQMGMIRTALRMSRQASVSFAPSLRKVGGAEQLALLQKLASAMDTVKHADLSGIHLVIDREPQQEMDAWGSLCLRSSDSALAWGGVLVQSNLQRCRQRKAVANQLERLEGSVAAALGVAMLYASPELTLRPEYTALLHALAHMGQQQGPVADGRLRNVPLCVTAGHSSADRGAGTASSASAGFEADEVLGLVKIPLSSDAFGIYRYLQEAAPAVSAAITDKQWTDAELEHLRSMTEKRLQLRILSRDPALAADRFKVACLRLLQASRSLSQLLEGLCLRISFTNQVAADGDTVDIAWDFEV